MSLLFRQSGVLTTVQDLGRIGFRRFGINPNGAMDRAATRLINILLGNAESTPVLEMHFPAPEIEFEEPTIFAVGGADFAARLDGAPIENWRPHRAEKNSVLKFAEKIFGNRAYLTVANGFRAPRRLGSASANLTAQFGGHRDDGGRAQKNDRLFYERSAPIAEKRTNFKISGSLLPFYSRFPTVRITAGAEFDSLTAYGEQVLRHENFIVSADSDRMGFRLAGEPIYALEKKELASSTIAFGTVQLLPDGQIIVLMADAPTCGGYPRIAHVAETDLPLVAQLGANDKIGFHLISHREAENLLLRFERDLQLLKIGVNYSANF